MNDDSKEFRDQVEGQTGRGIDQEIRSQGQSGLVSPSAEQVGPSAQEMPQPRGAKPKRWLLYSLVGGLVLLGVLFWVFKDQVTGWFVKQPSVVTPATNQTTPKSTKIDDPELVKFITPTTGETWLSQPKDMAPQGWFTAELIESYKDEVVSGSRTITAEEQRQQNMPTYKEVGARAGNTIVLVHVPGAGVIGMNFLFEKHPDNSVVAVARPQVSDTRYTDNITNLNGSLTKKVSSVDETIHYDSLNIPAQIPIDNGEFVLRPEYLKVTTGTVADSSDDSTTTRIATYGSSTLYKTEKKYTDTQLTNIGYYMKTPMGTIIGLRYEPNKPSLEGYTFTNETNLQYKDYEGKTRYDQLQAIARGCGGTSAAVTRSETLKDSDLTQVGKTDTGRAVYELSNKNATLYTKAYKEYKDAYTTGAVTFDQYVSAHGLVVMKNAKGELLVYVREQYSMGGGCAKPVVYLYPTVTSVVNVSVGADVTVSDPFYPRGGWKGVVARPDGSLLYGGRTYDSLFWEGQGYGDYPGITSGTVVKRADAAATMRRQLGEQGLNAKETTDFMAFWESKIPNKPYIRLTWLTTQQMDVLAPLRITPAPDTVKRVFLDMDGYDAPVQLPSQQLRGFTRQGFTVVEWGGLTSTVRH